MLTFNQYINEQYIDWDYVFSALMEEAEPIEFSKDSTKHSTTYNHERTVDGHTVQVSVLHSHGRNIHHVIFSVNGSTDIGQTTKDMSLQSRSKILGHVGRAVKSYVTDVVKTLPGKHKVAFTASDVDPGKEGDKLNMYGNFTKGLARATGGSHKFVPADKRKMTFPFHQITYDNEKANP